MSTPELDRAMIIDGVIERRLGCADAAEPLGIFPKNNVGIIQLSYAT